MSRPPLHTTSRSGAAGTRSAAEYEFQRITIPRDFSRSFVTRMLVDRAEHGGWEIDRLRDCREMAIETFLGRPIVVGRDDQRAVRAETSCAARPLDRRRRAVGAGSGEHRDPTGCRLDDERDDAVPLAAGQRGSFTGRAAGDEPSDSAGKLALDERPQS